MPTAAKIQWPQGQPLFQVQWRAVAESLAGNGVRSASDLEVTATATDLEIQVAAGTAFYLASESVLGAAETHTLTAGDGTYDRWDTVYFDTATNSSGVREGTPEASPEPPDVQGDELLLAVVYVPQGATDVPDEDVLNWRAQFSNEAEEIHYNDTTGVYGIDSVAEALNELQEAAQISAYPLAPATDLAVNGYPFLNSDLANSTITANAGTGLTTTSASIGLGGSATFAIATGGVTLTELDAPFSLPSVTDMDAAGNDLEDAGTTVWDTSEGHVPRPQVDQNKEVATVSTATTTSDPEVLFVDSTGGSFTVTLASADAVSGNEIAVIDVGGSADSDPITIDTEGSESIDGGTSTVLDSAYGAVLLQSDGTNWYSAGGSGKPGTVTVEDNGSIVLEPADRLNAGGGLTITDDGDGTATIAYEFNQVFEGRESGQVTAGNQGILAIDSLEDGEAADVYKAALTLADGQPAPASLDLVLATLDNAGGYTIQDTVLTCDGSTVHDDATGNPLATYTNNSGGEQSIAVLVNNQTGSNQSVMASTEGVAGI